MLSRGVSWLTRSYLIHRGGFTRSRSFAVERARAALYPEGREIKNKESPAIAYAECRENTRSERNAA